MFKRLTRCNMRQPVAIRGTCWVQPMGGSEPVAIPGRFCEPLQKPWFVFRVRTALDHLSLIYKFDILSHQMSQSSSCQLIISENWKEKLCFALFLMGLSKDSARKWTMPQTNWFVMVFTMLSVVFFPFLFCEFVSALGCGILVFVKNHSFYSDLGLLSCTKLVFCLGILWFWVLSVRFMLVFTMVFTVFLWRFHDRSHCL